MKTRKVVGPPPIKYLKKYANGGILDPFNQVQRSTDKRPNYVEKNVLRPTATTKAPAPQPTKTKNNVSKFLEDSGISGKLEVLAKKHNVDPAVLAANLYGEGFARSYKEMRNAEMSSTTKELKLTSAGTPWAEVTRQAYPISGAEFLGLDISKQDLDFLYQTKKISKSVYDNIRFSPTRLEKGTKNTAYFKSIDDALEVYGAEMGNRARQVKYYAKQNGYNIKNPDELAYWTTVAYNAGAGSMDKMMKAQLNPNLTPEQKAKVKPANLAIAQERMKLYGQVKEYSANNPVVASAEIPTFEVTGKRSFNPKVNTTKETTARESTYVDRKQKPMDLVEGYRESKSYNPNPYSTKVARRTDLNIPVEETQRGIAQPGKTDPTASPIDMLIPGKVPLKLPNVSLSGTRIPISAFPKANIPTPTPVTIPNPVLNASKGAITKGRKVSGSVIDSSRGVNKPYNRPKPFKHGGMLPKYSAGGTLAEDTTKVATGTEVKLGKQLGTTAPSTTPTATTSKSTTPSYSGGFSTAFAKARKELGANKVFSYNGKLFTTNYAEETAPKTAPKTDTKPTTKTTYKADIPEDTVTAPRINAKPQVSFEEKIAKDIKANPSKYRPATGAARTMDGIDDPIFGLLSGKAFGKLTESGIRALYNLYKLRNLRTYNISGELPPPGVKSGTRALSKRANGGALNTAADITSMAGGLASMIPGIGGVIGSAVSGIATPIMKSIAQGQAQRSNTNRMYSSTQMLKKGGMIKRKDGSYSKRGLWDNIRANKGSGKKPTPEMLEQERKIKKMEAGGTLSGRDDLTAYKGRLHRNGGIMVSAKGTPTKSNPAAEVEHNETRFSKGDTVYIFSDKLRI